MWVHTYGKKDYADKSQICIPERSTNVFGLFFSGVFVGKYLKMPKLKLHMTSSWHFCVSMPNETSSVEASQSTTALIPQ